MRAGIDTIKGVAAEHGREIEPDHYGMLVAYRRGELSDVLHRRLPGPASRARSRPRSSPTGPDNLRRRLEQFVEVGASKFVTIPVTEPADWTAELEEIAEAVVRPLRELTGRRLAEAVRPSGDG